MITIKDMASMLNMSTTTVSNVIHGKTKEVSEETVKKVRQMLEQYNYVPNINARNLASNSSKIIGLALRTSADKYTNLISDPFMGELVGAIEKEVRKMGYFFMIYISDDVNEILQFVSTWNADGLILVGMQSHDYAPLKERYKKPALLIDSYSMDGSCGYINIGLEDFNGSYMLTDYLIQNGHQKIGFVTDNLEGVDLERYKGYQKAMSQHGLPHGKDNVILLRPKNGQITDSLSQLYRNIENYTALSCASDYYAATIINYMQDRGIQVPDQLSVTGYDDNIFSTICRPAITTVHQDVTKKGEAAVLALFQLMKGETLEDNIRLPVELILRDSVKCITSQEIP